MTRMNVRLTASVLCLVWFGLFLLALDPAAGKAESSSPETLDIQYTEWLDLVHYIITPTEKEVFFKLTSNRERDAFITLFWNLRDPSVGTPQNEFRDEHVKRFEYANKYFKYGSLKPGWKTDRGRIYIILGPPVSKNEINENNLRPMEIWDYSGGADKGLPAFFHIVFYKPSDVGEYQLYIPAVDGPLSLLTGLAANLDVTDYEKIYETILQIEPEAAQVAFGLNPGENRMSFSPSLQDAPMIARVYELPYRRINTSYAKDFLNYQGLVDVSVSTNYIDLKTELRILKDPTLDMYFVHLALQPERFSVEQLESQDRYYCHFRLTVVLKRGNDVVLQYDRDFPLYWTKAEIDGQLARGIVLTDLLPVVEGAFQLTVILKNAVHDEIGYFEARLQVPENDLHALGLFDPLLSYEITDKKRPDYAAFWIIDRTVKIDPGYSFGRKEPLTSLICVQKGSYDKDIRLDLTVESLNAAKSFSRSYSLPYPQERPFWCLTHALESLAPGDYILKVNLSGDRNTVLDSKSRPFQISYDDRLAHPLLISRILQAKDRFYFYYLAALEYEKTKNPLKAEDFYEKALNLNDGFPDLVKSYAVFLMGQKKYDRVLSIIEKIRGAEKQAFDYFRLKGQAFYFRNDFHAAVEALSEANKIYDSDTSVLNTLGLAFLRLGEKDEAIKALTASLKVNKDQKEIERILLQLKQGRNAVQKRG